MSGTFRQLVINSKDRVNGSNSSTDFQVNFKQIVDGHSCFILESALIPNLIYNVTSSNNYVDFNDGSANLSASLTPGLYSLFGSTTSSNILTALGTAMTTASSGHGSLTFTATYSTTTGLITISGGGSTNIQLLFGTGSHASTSLAYLLGFSASNTASATTLTATNAPNLNVPYYLQISINGYNNILTSAQGFGTFVIPVDQSTGAVIEYSLDQTWTQSVLVSNPFNALSVRLLVDNQVVSLQNSDWGFVLKVQ